MPERSVLLTGCSSGFGRDLVGAFLKDGWSVAASLRGAKKRSGLLSDEARHFPGRLEVLELDVADASQRDAAASAVEKRFGGLDCLVNNAGYGLFGPLEELSEEDYRAQFETNFFGAAFLTRRLLPLLRRSKGRVINVSSVVGYWGLPLASAYCSSKFALEGFSESLYYELKPHGVQLALVEPGRFKTRFSDNIKNGKAADPASAYRAQNEAHAALREQMDKKAGPPSSVVVDAVLRLAGARSMPLRTRCGTDAKGVRFLQRLLPERLMTGGFAAVYARKIRARMGDG